VRAQTRLQVNCMYILTDAPVGIEPLCAPIAFAEVRSVVIERDPGVHVVEGGSVQPEEVEKQRAQIPTRIRREE
jgi:hypothetical protein